MNFSRRFSWVLLALLLLLGVLWLLRDPRPDADLSDPFAARKAVPGSPSVRERPVLGPVAGGAVFGLPAPPLRTSPEEGDWARRRSAYVPPSPQPDPGHPPGEQLLLESGPVIVPPGTRAGNPRGEATPRGGHPYVVQVDSADRLAERRQALEEAGGLVHGYLPYNAWLVELDDSARRRLESMPFVRALLAYEPEWRIQPWLGAAAGGFDPSLSLEVSVQTFLPEDAGAVSDRLRSVGIPVLSVVSDPGRRSGRVTAEVRLGMVSAIALWSGVQWIEEHQRPQVRNDLATAAARSNVVPLRAPWGLDGAGQTVGHADTGLDTGDTSTLHRDLRGRVAATAWGRPGNWSDMDGHGTHTAGTILGDGTMSGGQFAGAAPAASLFHQSVEDSFGGLGGLTNLYALFRESYEAGARVHSDSWGANTAGGYDLYSRAADEFAWDHPEFLAVFAAGNAGIDANADGVVDTGSVGSPATAKNVLAVGASESDRPTGGFSGFTYFQAWGSKFPANPIRNDTITWSYTTDPVYVQGMAAFSSRGPAADGRVKPEVTAPGCDVVSLRTSVGLWPEFDWTHEVYPADYTYNLGTSMATPLVAGGAALIRQALVRAGHPEPTAALVRAMVTGGARTLSPGQYGTGIAREIPDMRFNNVEGHGQLDVAGTLFPEHGRMARVHDRIPVSETEPFEVAVSVVRPDSAFRVVLAWSDPPATAGAGIKLVNDLDLSVTTPSGSVLRPATAGSHGTDSLNTLERIDLESAASGVYTVRVSAAALPDPDPDRFVGALSVCGALDEPPVLHHEPEGGAYVPSTTESLEVAVSVHYHRELDHGEAVLQYAYSGSAQPPWSLGDWESGTLDSGESIPGGWTYAAEIQSPAAGQYLHYRFMVDTATHSVTNPATGSHAVQGYDPVSWVVAGYPDEWGVTDPGYGLQQGIPGLPVTATASPTFSTNGVQRVRCLGHLGEGGIPFGWGSSVTFTLYEQPEGSPIPRLTWLWQAENALTQQSMPQGAVNRVDWFGAGSLGFTAPAPEIAWDQAGVPYALTGWWVGESRWPAASGPSPNPATGIPLPSPKTAEARYALFWEDSNGNGLRDAWELRWTGSLDSGLLPFEDPDGDGWTNLAEDLDNTDPNDPDSYPLPPVIADVTVFNSPVTSRPPYAVEATITDNFVVAASWLLWRTAGESDWNQEPMQPQGNDRYRAVFDPPFLGSAASEYCVVAVDLLGWHFPEFASTSAIHQVWSELQAPGLSFSPASPWVLQGTPEDVLKKEVSIANYGLPPLDYHLHLLGVGERFEQETPEQRSEWFRWSSSPSSFWQPVTRRSTHGEHAWYCGNPATWRYADSVYAFLDTPSFLVSSNAVFAYDQWIKTEHDAGEYYWDGGILTYSIDGGQSWNLLTPIGGYPHRIVPNPASPFPDHQPCFGGLGEGWHTVRVDLDPYAGEEMIISFEFGSDAYINDEGWYVDNVRVLSPDAPAQAILLSGATQGTLGFGAKAPFRLQFHPGLLPSGVQEESTLLLARHNDPLGEVIHSVLARYGFQVTASSTGPGSISFQQVLLFQGDGASLLATADDYADVRTVTTNAFSWATDPGTTHLSVLFSNLTAHVEAEVAFDWTLAEQGVPLWWFARYELAGDPDMLAFEDSDGDGMLNWQEYVANTSPTNPLSLLRIHTLEREEAGWRLRWSGGPDRTAVVERSASLPEDGQDWEQEWVLGPEGATEYDVALTNAPASFFRIRVLPPADVSPPGP